MQPRRQQLRGHRDGAGEYGSREVTQEGNCYGGGSEVGYLPEEELGEDGEG